MTRTEAWIKKAGLTEDEVRKCGLAPDQIRARHLGNMKVLEDAGQTWRQEYKALKHAVS